MRPFFQASRPALFAHRGGAGLWPENTLLAFREALGLGVTYLETDVHATRDGVLVVHHDASVQRTTDGFGLVRDHTYEDLSRLDAGYWHSPDGRSHPYRGLGLRVPTLEEVFALSSTLRLNIEIKQRHPSLVASLLAFIDERGLHDRVLVAAADGAIMTRFRRASGGRIATSASEREATRFWAAARLGLAGRLAPPYDALQVPVASGRLSVVTPSFVTQAHACGVEVHVWTIDEIDEMRRLLALGVDGIMSDRPDRFAALAVPPRAS